MDDVDHAPGRRGFLLTLLLISCHLFSIVRCDGRLLRNVWTSYALFL